MDEEFKELVIARLETMPDNLRVNLGNVGELDRGQLINHVKNNDALGKKILQMQIAYLKELKNL